MNKAKRAAITIAVLTVLSGLLANVVAGFFQSSLEPYKWWVVGVFLLIAIVLLRVDLQKWLSEHTKDAQDIQERRNRQAMLDKVQAIWITGFLDKSLEKEARIALGMSERPEAVLRSLDMVPQLPNQSPRHLPPNTQIVDVFDEHVGQLLILGAPGAGKTTLLLELTRDLLIRAKQDPQYPIPIVFPLSSWARDRKSLAEWLVEELNLRYDVPTKIAHAWIEQNQVLPLLDGLDEVAENYRGACVDVINRFRQEERGLLPLVVCCRVKDYEALGTALRLQGAIIVQPLTREQVNEYIRRVGDPLATIRQSLRTEATLWKLLDTPLMLNIMTLAYGNQPEVALHTEETLEACRHHLFAAYIDRMFRHRKPPTSYTQGQMMHWLTWLARQLVQHRLGVFHLEQMQPDWFSNLRKWQLSYGLFSGLFYGLVWALWSGLAIGLKSSWKDGVFFGLILGLCCGLLFGLIAWDYNRQNKDIIPVETVRWSLSVSEMVIKLVYDIGQGLLSGLTLGLLCQLVDWLSNGLLSQLIDKFISLLFGRQYNGLVSWLGGWLLVWLYIGPLLGLISWLEYIFKNGYSFGKIEVKTIPNQGIRRSFHNALGYGLIGTLVGVLFGELLTWLNTGHIDWSDWIGVLPLGLMFGLASGLYYGGEACLRHFVLRFLLVRTDFMPWDYPAFLDVAAGYLFLQKVGGGYIFVHQMLMEYFAALPDAQKHKC